MKGDDEQVEIERVSSLGESQAWPIKAVIGLPSLADQSRLDAVESPSACWNADNIPANFEIVDWRALAEGQQEFFFGENAADAASLGVVCEGRSTYGSSN